MTPTIQTYSGRAFNVAEPDPNDVAIIDIGHALSCQPRFAGHTIQFYSVAEHSVHVASMVPRRIAKAALLHDAAEAYMLDMPAPFKHMMPGYRELYRRVEWAICEAFEVDVTHPLIKTADLNALATEMRDVMRPVDWWAAPGVACKNRIVPCGQVQAKRLFLEMWESVK